jgi:hypothetical protein
MENQEQTPEMIAADLAALKEKADTLNIAYHPSIGAEKLREKIQLHVNPPTPPAEAPPAEAPSVIPKPSLEKFEPPVYDAAPVPAVAAPKVPETVGQKRKRLKDDAMALVRVRITCMNPAKKEWDGEILTVGNNLVGTITKFIPFNADEGWHITQIMLNMLRERQCQIFVEGKDSKGNKTRRSKIIREFAVEVLDRLTDDELAALVARQAATRAID